MLLLRTRAGEEEAHSEEDTTNGMAVMMSAFATAGGGVGVAYANTAFRNLGLLQFQDADQLVDLEGVVVQVRGEIQVFLANVVSLFDPDVG